MYRDLRYFALYHRTSTQMSCSGVLPYCLHSIDFLEGVEAGLGAQVCSEMLRGEAMDDQ